MDFSRYREVIPYARFSSAPQALGTSEERQHDAAAAFAQHHGITLSPRRVDRAKSGSKGQNVAEGGALLQVIQDVEAGRIPTPCLLLIERQDRYGRLPPTQALSTLFGSLLNQGCDLFHLNRNKLYSADGLNQDFGDLVTLAAEVHAAHQYAVQLSERSAIAHQKARERLLRGEAGVRPNWAPAWIEWDSKATQWVLTPYADTVRQLLQHVESGLGQIRTAAALNAAGLLTPRGKEWTAGSVSHILYSPAVAGGREVKRRSGQIAWDSFPAVITRARWEAIKSNVASRDNAAGAHGPNDKMLWLGQGLTYCTCGRAVGYRSASCLVQGQRKHISYLRCRGCIRTKAKGRCCDQPAQRMDGIQAQVIASLALGHWRSLFPTHATDRITHLIQQEQQARQGLHEAQAMASVAEAELTRAMREEPALISILARQVAAAEQAVATAETSHLTAAGAVEAARSDQSERDSDDLQQRVRQLGTAFLNGADQPSDRHAINTLLRRLNIQIHIDGHGQQVGLSIADGPVDWQPMDAALSRIALHQGGHSLQVAADGSARFEAAAEEDQPDEAWLAEG